MALRCSARVQSCVIVHAALSAVLAFCGHAEGSVARVDVGGATGLYTSIAIGSDGLGLISYRDGTNADLKVAHCSNPACTTATTTAIDTGINVGEFTSIAIGRDGLGLISYQDAYTADLKVAHCSNVACTSATTTAIDTAGDAGYFNTSIAIGRDGLGVISYYEGRQGDLKVAHCLNIACTSATTTFVDTGGLARTFSSAGQYSSITIGRDGLPLISYNDTNPPQSRADLKVAHCLNVACTSRTVSYVASGVAAHTSITIGRDGLGLISYQDRSNLDLKVAHCVDLHCSAATSTTLDAGGNVGLYTSIAIGRDGLGLISYHDHTNRELNVAHCSNVVCSDALTAVLDPRPGEPVGMFTSIAIGRDGLGLISYYNLPSADLNVAHCTSPQCLTPLE